MGRARKTVKEKVLRTKYATVRVVLFGQSGQSLELAQLAVGEASKLPTEFARAERLVSTVKVKRILTHISQI